MPGRGGRTRPLRWRPLQDVIGGAIRVRGAFHGEGSETPRFGSSGADTDRPDALKPRDRVRRKRGRGGAAGEVTDASGVAGPRHANVLRLDGAQQHGYQRGPPGVMGVYRKKTLVPRDGSPRKRRQVKGKRPYRTCRAEISEEARIPLHNCKVPSEGSR